MLINVFKMLETFFYSFMQYVPVELRSTHVPIRTRRVNTLWECIVIALTGTNDTHAIQMTKLLALSFGFTLRHDIKEKVCTTCFRNHLEIQFTRKSIPFESNESNIISQQNRKC